MNPWEWYCWSYIKASLGPTTFHSGNLKIKLEVSLSIRINHTHNFQAQVSKALATCFFRSQLILDVQYYQVPITSAGTGFPEEAVVKGLRWKCWIEEEQAAYSSNGKPPEHAETQHQWAPQAVVNYNNTPRDVNTKRQFSTRIHSQNDPPFEELEVKYDALRPVPHFFVVHQTSTFSTVKLLQLQQKGFFLVAISSSQGFPNVLARLPAPCH